MTADTRPASRSRCGVTWTGAAVCSAPEVAEYVWPPEVDDHHCAEQLHEPEAGFIVHACRCGAELSEPVT